MMSLNFEHFKVTLISTFCGYLLPAAILPLHIWVLSYFWSKYSRNVERSACTCSCWDTVFKGPYETGVATYKHMYFNATGNGCKMWIFTVLAVLSLYESVKRLVCLALTGRLRFMMAFLFLSSLFSHYYSWWGFINYWNDEFYTQWYHQLFFSITELSSTIIILYLANLDNFVSLRLALFVSGVGFLHCIAASFDQFIVNVIQGKGQAHQVVRDICLMVPDLLQFSIPILIVIRVSLKKRHPMSGYATAISEHRSELMALAILILIGIIISLLL